MYIVLEMIREGNMEYTKYNKSMVLLSEENRDFAAKTEQAIYGNLRVETGNNKGAISLSVQNLRFFERNRYIYKLILFGEKKERTIHAVIGSLILNRFGSGENYFRFDPNDVDGRGGKLEDYAVAIVAAVSMRDNKEPLHPVLKGKLSSLGSNVMAAGSEKGRNSRGGTEIEEKKEISEKENIEKRKMEDNKPKDINRRTTEKNVPQGRPTNKNNGSNHRNSTPKENREMREHRDNREIRENRENNSRKAFKEEREIFDDALSPSPYEIADITKKKKNTYNKYYNQYLKEVCGKTAKAAELYDSIVPFTKDKTGAQWKRIANVNNLPLVSPGATWGATKYRHYIFGESVDVYYLGIPGRFINEEQPEGGKSGFVLWQPIVGAESLGATKADCSLENKMTAYGYWITAIDKETGDIIDPV